MNFILRLVFITIILTSFFSCTKETDNNIKFINDTIEPEYPTHLKNLVGTSWKIIEGEVNYDYMYFGKDGILYYMYANQYGIKGYYTNVYEVYPKYKYYAHGKDYLFWYRLYKLTDNILKVKNRDFAADTATYEYSIDNPSFDEWIGNALTIETKLKLSPYINSITYHKSRLWCTDGYEFMVVDPSTLEKIVLEPNINFYGKIKIDKYYDKLVAKGYNSILLIDTESWETQSFQLPDYWISSGIAHDGLGNLWYSDYSNIVCFDLINGKVVREMPYKFRDFGGATFFDGHLYICTEGGMINKIEVNEFKTVDSYLLPGYTIIDLTHDGSNFWVLAFNNEDVPTLFEDVCPYLIKIPNM